MSKNEYDEFWKLHNPENMDVHAVMLIRSQHAEIVRLRRLCREVDNFFKSVGTILDADHIRLAYNNSSTKAEIDALKDKDNG